MRPEPGFAAQTGTEPMKVIDLSDYEDFQEACTGLWHLVASENQPQLIVGVETGGARVAAVMGRESGVPVVTVRRQRSLTKAKQTVAVRGVLKWLPRHVLDRFRITESRVREARFTRSGGVLRSRPVVMPASALNALGTGAAEVLVVDDAVDSGATLADVVARIRAVNAGLTIRTAVLCSTFRSPGFEVDTVLYRGAIVRGPWATDR
jgi:adenine/guanine phosphoribosyltransferase-like PRPP-binding protein